MQEIKIESQDNNPLSATAFIFYISPSSKTKEKIFFNQAALKILRMLSPDVSDDRLNQDFLSSLCAKWAELLEIKQAKDNKEETDADLKPIYLETIKSYRRKYAVKGAVLKSYKIHGNRSYIYILERPASEDLNLLKAFRKYQLSNREQEIIKLLLNGQSNKQIAYSLGLSSNTIKSYLKLLMRKLGVASRSGIIKVILSEH